MSHERRDRLARPRPHARRQVHVDFPCWVVDALDAEAEHLGVTRQALIKMWIAERLGRSVAGEERSRSSLARDGRNRPGSRVVAD